MKIRLPYISFYAPSSLAENSSLTISHWSTQKRDILLDIPRDMYPFSVFTSADEENDITKECGVGG